MTVNNPVLSTKLMVSEARAAMAMEPAVKEVVPDTARLVMSTVDGNESVHEPDVVIGLLPVTVIWLAVPTRPTLVIPPPPTAAVVCKVPSGKRTPS